MCTEHSIACPMILMHSRIQKHMRYSQVIHTTSLGRSRSKSQECTLHACAQLHNGQQYHVCHRAYSAVQQFIACVQIAKKLLCQCATISGSTAGRTYCLFCPSKARQGVRKAAVTSKSCHARILERSVFSESHMAKTLNTP